MLGLLHNPVVLTTLTLAGIFFVKRGVERIVGVIQYANESADEDVDWNQMIGKVRLRSNAVEAIKQEQDLWS